MCVYQLNLTSNQTAYVAVCQMMWLLSSASRLPQPRRPSIFVMNSSNSSSFGVYQLFWNPCQVTTLWSFPVNLDFSHDQNTGMRTSGVTINTTNIKAASPVNANPSLRGSQHCRYMHTYTHTTHPHTYTHTHIHTPSKNTHPHPHTPTHTHTSPLHTHTHTHLARDVGREVTFQRGKWANPLQPAITSSALSGLVTPHFSSSFWDDTCPTIFLTRVIFFILIFFYHCERE